MYGWYCIGNPDYWQHWRCGEIPASEPANEVEGKVFVAEQEHGQARPA